MIPLLALLAATAVSGPGGGTEEATVRALDDQERAAVLARDREALARLWAEDLAVNSPANEIRRGRQAVLDLVERGVMHYASFERQVEFLRVDGDLAIVMGAETIQPIGDAPLAGQTVRRRFTNIWRKENGTWRLVARHANVAPTPVR